MSMSSLSLHWSHTGYVGFRFSSWDCPRGWLSGAHANQPVIEVMVRLSSRSNARLANLHV
jgi:hypothetical protein